MIRGRDVQADGDIRRATEIIAHRHGTSPEAGAHLLAVRAGDFGISVHAVALAVLSGDEAAGTRIPASPQGPARQRLREALRARVLA